MKKKTNVSNDNVTPLVTTQTQPEKTSKKKIKFQKMDWLIFIPYLILAITGVVMVYSASAYRLMEDGQHMWRAGFSQAVFLILSLIVVFIVYVTKPSFWRESKIVDTVFWISVVLLLLVLVIGARVNGAKGWFNIGPIQFQPMELFKVMVIVMMARLLALKAKLTFSYKLAVTLGIVMALALIMLQPDTGGVIICSLIILALLACAGQSPMISLTYIGAFVAVALLGLVVFPHLPFIPEYMRARFLVAYNPFNYALGSGHQLINSYYALSNGGWFGRGLGNSIEKQGFLPEAQTDFIFSIIVEELGMVVGIGIIALLLFLIFRILYIGLKAKDSFNSYICIGISVMLFIQMFVNLGGLVGLIPLTGVTLPFLSQGGSSLLLFSVGIALALNVSASEYENRMKHRSHAQIKVVK